MSENRGHWLVQSITDRSPLVLPTDAAVSRQGSYPWLFQIGRLFLITILLCSLIGAQPVVAQEADENPVCSDESGTLPDMIEGFVQLTTAFGFMGLLVVWQIDELAEMFTLGAERKQALKKHKLGAMKSATVLLLLGPLFTIAGSVMELPVAQCVDLVPF